MSINILIGFNLNDKIFIVIKTKQNLNDISAVWQSNSFIQLEIHIKMEACTTIKGVADI